ncbi:MAG: hypothetical protein Q8P18_24270 [Pseudomonadota bacterium]|nr:hypothetical protein [Pseudomonadota bacterium]
MAILLSLALCASGAHAGTLATAFSDDDAGSWTGGTVSSGVLTIRDGEVVLAPGTMRSFHLATRVRLAEGTQLWFGAGDATLAASYAAGGGLTLGAASAPLPLGEQAWSADAATSFDGRSPDLLRFGAEWLLYREDAGFVHAARSSDGITWTDLGPVVAGSAPDAVQEADGVVLYVACPDVDAVCRAESADGAAFDTPVPVLYTSAPPSVTVTALDAGGWRMWIDDGSGVMSATSADGSTWGAPSVVATPSRLHDLDVVSFPGGLAAAWVGSDGVYGTDALADADLATTTGDRGPLVAAGFASWGEQIATAPTLDLLGPTWHLWVETEAGRLGHLVGVPAAGGWVGLVVDWDGDTLTATWGTGATLSTSLAAVDAMRIGAVGLLEMDEAQLAYELDGSDTGEEAGDTGAPTVDSADTGAVDTVSPDTGLLDTAVILAVVDTAAVDTAPQGYWGAADLSGEPGGWGCTPVSAEPPAYALLALVGLFLVRRRT